MCSDCLERLPSIVYTVDFDSSGAGSDVIWTDLRISVNQVSGAVRCVTSGVMLPKLSR